MWHVEGFNAKSDATELASWLQESFLPAIRSKGFVVRIFATQMSLGPRQFWLATEIEQFRDLDGWAARAGSEGAALIAELLSRTEQMQGGIVTEL